LARLDKYALNITAVETSKGFIMIAARHHRTFSFVIVDNLGLYVKRIGRLIMNGL